MTAEIVERFPLFPLGLVLLPREVVPLHIFEERYKTMIGECLDEEREFGIVWLSQDGLRETGCGASVVRLLERTEDGRMNILAEGTRPFRLLRRIDDLVYPAGDVELLDDEGAAAAIDPELLAAARDRYADLVDRATDTRPEPLDLTELDAYGMAATVDFELAAKQELLELRDEEARLRRVRELFDLTLARLDYAERAGELARTNGRARPGRP
ncbi:MAG: LON peptidase substrate-binding domain-containing protein [Thermoleophilaceae bacterium]|nr:LON peptidase substrate-binding domain-containing protein [Thermoleophilaceae bacterium]